MPRMKGRMPAEATGTGASSSRAAGVGLRSSNARVMECMCRHFKMRRDPA
jgi:hypothetical protein